MMEEMAAASTAVKFGSEVMAEAAALTVSASEGCWLGCKGGLGAKASSQQQARESPGDDVREHVAFECSQHELHNSLVCKLHCPFH